MKLKTSNSLQVPFAVGLEPAFGGFVIGIEAGDLGPEGGGVVEVPEMGEFVEDDVVGDLGRELDEAPVEGDDLAGGAGAPSGPLVADLDGADLESVERGEFEGAGGEFLGGEGTEAAFDARAEVGFAGGGLGNAERADFEEGAVLGVDDVEGLAMEPDGGAEGPLAWVGRTVGTGGDAAADPGDLAADEFLASGAAAAVRDRAAEGSVAAEGQSVEPGAGMGDEVNLDRLAVEVEEEPGSRRVSPVHAAGGSGWAMKVCSVTGVPPMRCSWMIRSRTSGVQPEYQVPSG